MSIAFGDVTTGKTRALEGFDAQALFNSIDPSTLIGLRDRALLGTTLYLKNDDQLEHAQFMAGHASPRTTKLYDRRKQEATFDEVERTVL